MFNLPASLPPSSRWHAFPPSSPLYSSSPPTTPGRGRDRHCRCLRVGIRSSPGIGVEIRSDAEGDDSEALGAWRSLRDLPAKHPTLPGIKSLFAEELNTARSARSRASPFKSTHTSEDDDNSDSDSEGLSFADLDARATFFRVSAERGRWRYDPPSLRPQVLHRQSAPMSSPSPVSDLNMPIRPISEPLPMTLTPPPQPMHPEEPSSAVLSSSDLLSLIENTDGDRETESRAYSPLPPSSPPLSSSPLPAMRSISPLSFAPSSPRLPPSSPLSFLDSLPPSEQQELDVPFSLPPTLCGDNGDGATVAVAKELFGDEEKEVGGSGSGSGLDVDAAGPEDLGSKLDLMQCNGKVTSKLKDEEALRIMDENGVDGRVNKTRLAKAREKRKKREGEDDALSSRKKAKAGISLESDSGSGLSVDKRKTKKEVKRRFEEDHEEENEPAPKQKKQKKAEGNLSQRKRCTEAMTSSAQVPKQKKLSTPHASSSPPPPLSPPPSSKTQLLKDQSKLKTLTGGAPFKDPESEAMHAEIRGMLIETMATSRASSLPASALYRSAMQCRPSLEAQRSEKEWVEIIERVLGEGEAARGGSGVFGKVESSFKDDSGRPLEAQWFYVPEMDEDQERAALIRSMMPRPAKRNETKKYKQYYYRPLGKITRWDREEDL